MTAMRAGLALLLAALPPAVTFETALLGSAVNGLVGSAKAAGTPVLWATMVGLDMVPGLPTQPATVAAGATLGFWQGLSVTCAAQTTAAALSLQLARRLGSEGQLLGDFLSKTRESGGGVFDVVSAVAEKVDGTDPGSDWRRPFMAIYVLRNSPIVPFTLGNYLIGATTRAPLAPMLMATLLGCLPANCCFAAAGAGLSALADGGSGALSPAQQGLAALGVAATVLVTFAGADAVKQATENEAEAEA
eukprot:CAMPEP_0118880398 /NCGR_PEP_ID=MMETSP1163-20130328/19986_1 /TAXON_ID=124430 /ORGANISM="Phaeomonas parva, Strain CCMP2877" /LENGTH=246 /DNA_ID=CAMNT_0006816797 /DNA_START=116 /DNA_END=856 /DNA_ORIENTATION=-